MNKGELIDAVAELSGLSKKDARAAVDAMFDPQGGAITRALRKGGKVAVAGFGTFEARARNARTARNPRTGETIQVPASKAPAFRAGKSLREAIN
jgi:DNA-binding protein HU-beta